MSSKSNTTGSAPMRAAISIGVTVIALAAAHRTARAQVHADASTVTTMDAGSIDASAATDGGAAARAMESPPAVASANVPLRNLLGRTLHEVNADAGAPIDGGGSWRPYRGDVFVQFRGERVVRVTARVPAWSECSSVARRFGFDHAMPPIRRNRGCEWPARSLRHLLESGLAAQFDGREGSFEVWVVE